MPQSSRLQQWARLFKRMFDINMQHCPNCGAGELKTLQRTALRLRGPELCEGAACKGLSTAATNRPVARGGAGLKRHLSRAGLLGRQSRQGHQRCMLAARVAMRRP